MDFYDLKAINIFKSKNYSQLSVCTILILYTLDLKKNPGNPLNHENPGSDSEISAKYIIYCSEMC